MVAGCCAVKAGTHVKAWQCDASMDVLKLDLQSWTSRAGLDYSRSYHLLHTVALNRTHFLACSITSRPLPCKRGNGLREHEKPSVSVGVAHLGVS